ncbi:MAG: DUF4277 domain-containing protein [Psychromonas sp.]|nr:DUF4277 domain-containing protein [Psychromonas sp.]
MKIKRLDHLGIVSGFIYDLNIVADIVALLPIHDFNKITYGEAVKGMIIINMLAMIYCIMKYSKDGWYFTQTR